MSRVEAAAGMDRLPWLPDEPPPAKRRGGTRFGWTAAGLAVVAVGTFWISARISHEQTPKRVEAPAPVTTVRLPAPRPAEPQDLRLRTQPGISPPPAPEVRAAPEREVRLSLPSAKRSVPADQMKSVPTAQEAEPVPAAPAAAPSSQPFVMPKAWNPRVFAGASGRLVQVGAFGSVRQAKRGWWYMVRSYPAVAHLPAVVRPARNSKGHVFYRFQVGTTSQAHSEVLCQRMERIRFSCAVVGLPWKAKVER